MWSQRFAEEIAETLGYSEEALNRLLEGADEGQRREAICFALEGIVGHLAEVFRYLPLAKIQWTRDFATLLRGRSLPSGPALANWIMDKLHEVRDFALFLKERYGYSEPADESDEWTEEDERDATLASLRRLDEDDPYPWEESENAPPSPR